MDCGGCWKKSLQDKRDFLGKKKRELTNAERQALINAVKGKKK